MTQNELENVSLDLGKMNLGGYGKLMEANKLFWEAAKQQVTSDNTESRRLDGLLREFQQESGQVRAVISKFESYIREIPIFIAVGSWAKGLVSDPFWMGKYLDKMARLQELKIVPYLDRDRKYVTLEFFMQCGHQSILENIRCVKALSLLEKEEAVQCYVAFSHSLSRQTYGLIPHGFDPDRDRARHKAIKYEAFIDFIQQLPPRDALIAKLLYFGAPSLEEALSLKRAQLELKNPVASIHFDKEVVFFPRHVMSDLVAYLNGKTEGQELVFINVRGAEVERAHLNQSFARACKKMSKEVKITPGSLLKLERESQNDDLWKSAPS